VGLDELFWAWDSVGNRLSLFRELPDGGRSPATKLELAVAYAISIARALKWQRISCETLNGNHGAPWGLEKVLKELPSLHGGLINLGGVLSDTSVRHQLASANTDAVEFSGEFAPSYAEAVFAAGERLLVTIAMLCLHGVEYNFLSRLHPASKPEDLGEPWKSVPVPSDVVFKPNHAGCLRSQEMLVSRIANFILGSPEVNDDHVRILLEKEIGRVATGETPPTDADAIQQHATQGAQAADSSNKIKTKANRIAGNSHPAEKLLLEIKESRQEYLSASGFAAGESYGALASLERIWEKARSLGLDISRYPDFDTHAMFIAGIKGGVSDQSVPGVSAKAFEDFHEALVFAEKICRARIGMPAVSESMAAERKAKRSTVKGEARAKIIAGLNEHHGYDNGSCTNLTPIQVGDFATKTNVSKSSVSVFLKAEFAESNEPGYTKYKIACQDTGTLGQSLKILNGELTPSILFNSSTGDHADTAE